MRSYRENPEGEENQNASRDNERATFAAKRVRLYYAKEFRPERWHVIGPDGRPVYDDRPNGDDEALVFHTHDAACECARNLREYGED